MYVKLGQELRYPIVIASLFIHPGWKLPVGGRRYYCMQTAVSAPNNQRMLPHLDGMNG